MVEEKKERGMEGGKEGVKERGKEGSLLLAYVDRPEGEPSV